MKLFNWQTVLGIVLLALSTLVYSIHYLVFRDPHHLFMFLVGDIAFVFIEVLLVTMILHRLLEAREKKAKLKKLNMVIGSFFSDTGTGLLERLATFDTLKEQPKEHCLIGDDWSSAHFSRAIKEQGKAEYAIDARAGDLEELLAFMKEKRNHLLRLLENPNLLEHESFTDMLWAVSHVGEELGHRRSLKNLSERDLDHLSGDIQRAYSLAIAEWLAYMQHLKEDYPYLFSLCHRINPFSPEAKAEVN